MGAFATERLIVSTILVGFSPFIAKLHEHRNATRAYVTVEAGPVRFYYSEDEPTQVNGHLLSDGDAVYIDGATDVANSLFIRASNTDGVLNITYER